MNKYLSQQSWSDVCALNLTDGVFDLNQPYDDVQSEITALVEYVFPNTVDLACTLLEYVKSIIMWYMKQKLYSEFVETVTLTRLCAGDSCLKATWGKCHQVDLILKGKLPSSRANIKPSTENKLRTTLMRSHL